jgi:hypothetical protein
MNRSAATRQINMFHHMSRSTDQLPSHHTGRDRWEDRWEDQAAAGVQGSPRLFSLHLCFYWHYINYQVISEMLVNSCHRYIIRKCFACIRKIFLVVGFAVEQIKADSSRVLLAANREYGIIYRGPDFLVVVWFGSFPPPPLSHWQLFSFSNSSCVSPGRA